jgi:hypothetical protein
MENKIERFDSPSQVQLVKTEALCKKDIFFKDFG